jgi:lysophospholipase L1-like esterase
LKSALLCVFAPLRELESFSTKKSPAKAQRRKVHFVMKTIHHLRILALLVLAGPASSTVASGQAPTLKFDFGPGKVANGHTQILQTTVYSKELGYGFEPGANVSCIDRGLKDALRSDLCTSDQPFFFSVAVPEGNYNVSITFGDAQAETMTTVKAELRRLMLEKVHTAPGTFVTNTFTVNVRNPQISAGREVKLKDREKTSEAWAWDEKLTLEVNNTRPSVNAIEIKRTNSPTLFLLGDSTVCDQPGEPFNSWGQMLPRFFRSGIAIANHAESGESLKSSLGAKRLEKVLSVMQPGDYLFIQYGHNDEKEKGEGVGAFTSYKASLKHFVEETRKHGGLPILITPMHRRTFDDQGKITNSHGDYVEAVRQAAKEENVPLIDLNDMSETLYEAWGSELSKRAFAPNDGTHHNNYGSYELAKCIVEGIRSSKLGLRKYLSGDATRFDPRHPDPIDSFRVPASPQITKVKPLGS